MPDLSQSYESYRKSIASEPTPSFDIDEIFNTIESVKKSREASRKAEQDNRLEEFKTAALMKNAGFNAGINDKGQVMLSPQPANYMDPALLESQLKQAQLQAAQSRTQLNQKRLQQTPELSPSLQKIKDERTSELIRMSEENPIKLNELKEAESLFDEALQGRLGKIDIKRMMEADPNNPILSKWQSLKSVLTNAQLDYVQKTKGAISDREMQLFGQSVANDDLLSASRMKPQLKKLRNSIIANQNSSLKSYKKIYGEDPSSFINFQESGVEFGNEGNSVKSSNKDIISKLGLDPNKYEIV